MEFGVSANVGLGIAFLAVGILASILQYWLWTFPMVPDPTGVDPNGVTTAPKFWRYAHRSLGYAFVGIYLILAVEMVPRLWNYSPDAWSVSAVVHAVAGLLIGLTLVAKVLILRRFQRLGNKLLIIGSALLLLSVGAVALVAPPALKVLNHPGDDQARQIVIQNCTSCHGLSVVAGKGGGPEKWYEILEEMAEKAEKRGMGDPSQGQQDRLVAFLASMNPHQSDGDEDGDDSGRRRGRERERED